ncbi:MAG: 4-hydroxy-tetrahydrodipicolinate synthase [Bdellovibrio sp.]|nr:MAG: 4-hydroxy-tetrahydrodipicolinate synthase [Bdellovibrio sp.]
MTALATPFQDGQVDFASLKKLMDWQVSQGVDGFVVNGTTAESPTLSADEVREIFLAVQGAAPKSAPLIVGTGSNATSATVSASQRAEAWGADAVLVVVPYYNRPPQRGLIEHFQTVASSVSIPVILYNVPGRTVTGLELETIRILSEHKNIIGIKEASGNLDFAREIKRTCGENFLLFSGDDATADEFQKLGGQGVISVASAIIPRAMKELRTGQFKEVVDLLYCESSPIPVKAALYLMKIIATPEMRLPLVPLSAAWTEKLAAALTKAQLL